MKFLAYDGPFMTWFRRLINYILLGILWVLASIPVITFGAATTAAFQTAEISIHKDEGKMFHTFYKCFRKEFKQATLLWLLELPLLAILVMDLLLVSKSTLSGILQCIIYVVVLAMFCWIQLWFGYLSKFVDTTRTLLRNTFRMMLGNFGRTLLMSLLAVLCLVGAVVTFLMLLPFPLLFPGLYIMGYMALLRKIFVKYIPVEEAPEIPAEA